MSAAKLIARPVRAQETDQMLALMCRSFQMNPAAARRVFYADPFFDLSHKRVLIDDDGKIVSCLTLIPAELSLGRGAGLPICGIAGVCTDPDQRGQGYAASLIQQTMRQIAKEFDYAAAALTAARPEYYRTLGWEVCGNSVEIIIPAASINESEEQSPQIRELIPLGTAAFSTPIRKIYDQLRPERTPGSFYRDGNRWQCIENVPGRRVAGFFTEGKLTGYAAFSTTGSDLADGFKAIVVHELICGNADEELALLNFLAREKSCIEVHCYFRPSQAERILAEGYPGAAAQPSTPVLMRAVDLHRLATSVCRVQPEAAKDLSGNVEFEICVPETATISADRITLSVVANGAATLRRSSTAPLPNVPTLTGSLGTVTQMMLGYRSARALLSDRLLELTNQSAKHWNTICDACDSLFLSREIYLAPPDLF